MKTILYNTAQKTVTYHAQSGYYKVDGVRPTLPNDVVELEVITTPPNTTSNEVLERGAPSADVASGFFYPVTYTVRDKTAAELAAEQWKHPQYMKKLTFSRDLLGVALVMEFVIEMVVINKQPYEFDANNFSVWGNSAPVRYTTAIQSAVQSGLATAENRPQILG